MRKGSVVAIALLEDSLQGTIACEVSDEIASVLTAPDPPLREVTFTDLSAGRGRDLAAEPWLSNELRLYYRGQLARADISSWEGPRFSFPLLLGAGRVWDGEPVRGFSCRICRGAELPPSAACLGCCRTGRDAEIPSPPREVLRRAAEAERERAGKGRRRRGVPLKGGVGA